MDKNELAKILKPLIKECIKEVLMEESGVLAHVIKESVQGCSVTLFSSGWFTRPQRLSYGRTQRMSFRGDFTAC